MWPSGDGAGYSPIWLGSIVGTGAGRRPLGAVSSGNGVSTIPGSVGRIRTFHWKPRMCGGMTWVTIRPSARVRSTTQSRSYTTAPGEVGLRRINGRL